MISTKNTLFILSTLTLISLLSCKTPQPISTVDQVDLDKYSGTWYEIATIPASFQKGCTCVSATYTPKEDYVEVYNKCLKNGKMKDVKGKAFAVEGSNNSRLKVQFFWPFKGDYYILDLDPNYQWAMIGEPSRKYFWILSRDKQMKEGLYSNLIRKAKEEFGYDTNQVVMTDQSCE